MHTPDVLWPAPIGRAGQPDALAPVRAKLCRTLDANVREDACFDAPMGTIFASDTASADADLDNGAVAFYGAPRPGGCDGAADRRLVRVVGSARRPERSDEPKLNASDLGPHSRPS
jgi:hypothetical protein